MIKDNKIYCGDNVEILKTFPDNCIDCVVTSPPYDSARTYKGYSFRFEKVAIELYRVLKEGGVVVWNVNDETVKGSESLTSFKQAIFFVEECRFRLHDTMYYEKNSSSFPAKANGNRYTQTIEYVFILSKGAPKTAKLICDKKNRWEGWKGFGKTTMRNKEGELVEYDKKPTPEYSPRNNIWRYNTGKGFSSKGDTASQHPAIMPIGLAVDHIRTWTQEGDIVLDPFNGSGTTICASKFMNRKYIGIDVSEEYCKLAEERLKEKIDIEDIIRKNAEIQAGRYPQDSQKKEVKSVTDINVEIKQTAEKQIKDLEQGKLFGQ
jgi:site-specific DNA-methyltransferase (adenine-specific)